MQVLLVMAMTVDGMIAKDEAHFPNWTGKADKQLFKRVTRDAGVVIMGSKTFDTIAKPLPDRKNVIISRDTRRRSAWPNLMFTSKKPHEILNDLNTEGYTKAVLAGGATVNSLFAQEGLIDELLITYTPVVFGQGLSLFNQPMSMKLELLTTRLLDANVYMAHYCVVR